MKVWHCVGQLSPLVHGLLSSDIFSKLLFFFHVVKQQYISSNIIEVKINMVTVSSCTIFCKVMTYVVS